MVKALNDYTILLLICHFLGDYHLQWETLSQEKYKKASGMLKHFGIHLALLLVLFVWAMIQGLEASRFWPLLVIFGVHVVLDLLKMLITKAIDKKPNHSAKLAVYLIDQMLHILAIVLISQYYFSFPSDIVQLFSFGGFLTREMLNWMLLLLLITKPANVSFKIFFEKYQFKEDELEEDAPERMAVGIAALPDPVDSDKRKEKESEKLGTVPGAGGIIGNMERILSAVFLAAGQWAAIGIVFTAKSIARFKQIEKNKQFAEYYLIGTLYSILYVVLAFYLVIKS